MSGPPGPVVLPVVGGSAGSPSRRQMAKRKTVPVDVTHSYEERGDEVCSICYEYDPPLEAPDQAAAARSNNTEWVGCDCGAWYHKACTKLTEITNDFSCVSVKIKCLT